MADKTIYVISDLHMGDGGPRDNFAVGNREQELKQFLDFVERENGDLIILGDLFDFWQANFSRVLINNMPLIERLGEMEATYVVGNHDIDLVGFIKYNLLKPNLFQKLSDPFTCKRGNRTFYFMHGHDVDPYNKGEIPGKGRLLTIVAGIAESFVGSPRLSDGRSVESVLERAGEGFVNALKRWGRKLLIKCLMLCGVQTNEQSPAQNPDWASEMLLHYKAHREKNRYDVAVVGHTHRSGRIGDWYFNSGSWVNTDNSFVRISPNGEVKVFNWTDNQPEVNTTVLIMPETPKATKRANEKKV
jgi:UDP-2,3-diacylglucosamine pyrophosphatase LpxH